MPLPNQGTSSPAGNRSDRADNKDTVVSTLRICHLADIHLGYRRYSKIAKNGQNQREMDVNLAFQEAVARIIGLKPDLTVIAGDLFHSVRPSNQVVTFCFRQLRKLAKETGAPVVIVGGNHEAPKRSDTGSVLQLFGEIEGISVADTNIETFTFKAQDCSVTCVPHVSLLQERGSTLTASQIKDGKLSPQAGRFNLRADDRCKHNVLVVHAQVNEGWVSDFGGVELDLRALSPHEWDYIALGHVHIHRQVGLNAAYSGSVEHTATNIWSEAKELKGFLEVSLPSGKRSFHPLTSPRDVVVLETVDATDLPPEAVMDLIVERCEGTPGGMEGKIVRLDVRGISRETYRHLNHKEIRTIKSKALHFSIDISFATSTPAASAVSRPGKGMLREELATFCSTWQVPGVTHQELSDVLLSYVGKIEAKYEAS